MITVGQLNALVGVVQAFPTSQFAKVVAEKGEGLADDEILAADVLTDIAAILPPPFDIYAGIAATLLELAATGAAAANITVTPDPWPERDAQTSTDPHRGRG